MPLNAIAKFLNKSTTYVQSACQKIITDDADGTDHGDMQSISPSPLDKYISKDKKTLTKEQKIFLTLPSTLMKWATYSIA